MFRRKRMSRSRSKKLFRRTARRVHRRNMPTSPMRGGIRL